MLSRSELPPESQLVQVQEQVRHHEDRMSYLESRHGSLQRQVSFKVAIDSEFDDWVTNRSDEDWFSISGLPRLGELTRQEWQNAARRQIADYIKLVLQANRSRLDFEVLYVANRKHQNTGPTNYDVQMDSVHSSRRIRDLFSGFFRKHRPVQRPPPLKGVAIRNKITLESKIRIAILRQIGVNYEAANKGSSFKVRGFGSRPNLFIIPPKSASERPRTFNFIPAVRTLPANFTDDNLIHIYQVIGDRLHGRLRSLFIVLNDDDHERCLELVKASCLRAGGSGSGGGAGGSHSSDPLTVSGVVAGEGSGMDLAALDRRSGRDWSPRSNRGKRRRSDSDRSPTPVKSRSSKKRRHSSSEPSSKSKSKTKSRSKRKNKHKRKKAKRVSSSSSSSSKSSSSSSPSATSSPGKVSRSKSQESEGRDRSKSRSPTGATPPTRDKSPVKARPSGRERSPTPKSPVRSKAKKH